MAGVASRALVVAARSCRRTRLRSSPRTPSSRFLPVEDLAPAVPTSTTWPLSIITTAMETSRTNAISWQTISMVMPSLASPRMVSSTSLTSSGSSAEVTSSSSRISGFKRQRAGDGDALLLAAGQLVGIGVSLSGEARPWRGCRAASASTSARGPLLDLDRRDRDVAHHVHVLEQVVLLEHDRHAVAQRPHAGARGVVDRLAVDDAPRRRSAASGPSARAAACSCRSRTGRSGDDLALVDRQGRRRAGPCMVHRSCAEVSDFEVRQGVSPDRRRSG